MTANKEPCKICNETGLTEYNGRTVICHSCQGTGDSANFELFVKFDAGLLISKATQQVSEMMCPMHLMQEKYLRFDLGYFYMDNCMGKVSLDIKESSEEIKKKMKECAGQRDARECWAAYRAQFDNVQ